MLTLKMNPDQREISGLDEADIARRAEQLARKHEELMSSGDSAEQSPVTNSLDDVDADVALLQFIQRVRDRDLKDASVAKVSGVPAETAMESSGQNTTLPIESWISEEIDRIVSEKNGEPPNARFFQHSLGRFRIQSILGRGGFGVVFDAIDPQLGRSVALKVPKIDNISQSSRRRFLREAQAAGMLSHPHIVTVYESGQLGPILYIAYERIRGPSLADWLSRRPNRVSIRGAARIVATMADAIQHAHSRSIIHRDLKPANVLVDTTSASGDIGEEELIDALKITDFGLAKGKFSDHQSLTESGALVGTPNYMAPEQVRGSESEISPATDVYALGAILYELLTGRPPFQKPAYVATLRAIEEQEPVAPRRIAPQVPRDLEAICLKCLEKKPAIRFSSASALADDLRAFLSGAPVQSRQITSLQRMGRWALRNPIVATLLSLLILSLVTGLAVSYLQNRNTQWQLEETKKNYWQARKAVDELMVAAGNPELEGLPEVRRDLLQTALRYYAWFVSQEQDDPTLQKELAYAYCMIGSITSQLGAHREALNAYQSAQSLLDRIVDDNAPPQLVQMRIENMIDIGLQLGTSGQWASAQASYLRAIEEIEKSLGESPTDQNLLSLLARACSNQGATLQTQGKSDEAITFYKRGLEIREKLVADYPDNQQYAISQSRAHSSFVDWYLTQRDFGPALDHAHQANEILVRLSESDPNSLTLKTELSKSWNTLGDVYRQNPEPANGLQQALDYYGRATAIQEKLVKDFPLLAKPQTALANSLVNLADVHSRLKQTSASIEHYRMAIEILNRARGNSDNSRLVDSLVLSHFGLAKQLQLEKQPEQALAECMIALKYHEEILQTNPELAASNRTRHRRALALQSALNLEMGNQRAAMEAAERRLQLGYDGPDAKVLLARILLFGDPELRDRPRALELLTGLPESSPKSFPVHFYTGAALCFAGKTDDSLAMLDKATAIAKQNGPEKLIRAMCLHKLNRAGEAKNELEDAKQWLDQQKSLRSMDAKEYATIHSEAKLLIDP